MIGGWCTCLDSEKHDLNGSIDGEFTSLGKKQQENMEISWNRGTPKSSISMVFSMNFWPSGANPHFGNPYIHSAEVRCDPRWGWWSDDSSACREPWSRGHGERAPWGAPKSAGAPLSSKKRCQISLLTLEKWEQWSVSWLETSQVVSWCEKWIMVMSRDGQFKWADFERNQLDVYYTCLASWNVKKHLLQSGRSSCAAWWRTAHDAHLKRQDDRIFKS